MEIDEFLQLPLVLQGRKVGQSGSAAGGNQEVCIEGDGTSFGRPVHQLGQLILVALGERRLHHEVESGRDQAVDGSEHRLERSMAPAETVVIRGIERLDRHRHARHPRRLEFGDLFVGEERAVRANHDRGATAGSVGGDRSEVVSEQWLPTRQDEHRRGIDRENLVDDTNAFFGGQLIGGRLLRARRDVTVGAFEIAAAGEIPGNDVRHEVARLCVACRCVSQYRERRQIHGAPTPPPLPEWNRCSTPSPWSFASSTARPQPSRRPATSS